MDNLVNHPNKKSSPINIEQLKALNRSSITSSSPSYHHEQFSNSPSSHYATFAQHSKDGYYSNSKPYERPGNSSNYAYLGHQPPTSPTSPLHLHQSSHPVESFSSLSSHYPPDE